MGGGRHRHATAADAHRIQQPVGSIPARAGEPRVSLTPRSPLTVYPRACGGTRHHTERLGCCTGLSPRVRGNHSHEWRDVSGRGSIPARAGEPTWLHPRRSRAKVYPRACGGTASIGSSISTSIGLSPRVRGNRSLPRNHVLFYAVYPRACGGTTGALWMPMQATGLSPRVRGNRPRCRYQNPSLRSIPARAGEPLPAAPDADASEWVYPRACGGTALGVGIRTLL